jgi:hypothetical protein
MKLAISTFTFAVAAALALAGSVAANDGSRDLDPRMRAKLAKAKAKAAAQEAEQFNFLANQNGQTPGECGSQAIGNVELNRQAGVGPREIFVFAPNAINIVGPRGCQ